MAMATTIRTPTKECIHEASCVEGPRRSAVAADACTARSSGALQTDVVPALCVTGSEELRRNGEISAGTQPMSCDQRRIPG